MTKKPHTRSPVTVVVISSDGEGDRLVESLEVKAPVGRVTGQIRTGGPATWQAAAVVNQRSRENRAPRETDCGNIGSAEPFGPWRRPMSTSEFWTETMIELPGVREGGMSGRNEQ